MKIIIILILYFLICGGVLFYHCNNIRNSKVTSAMILKIYYKKFSVGKFNSEIKMAILEYEVEGKKFTFETDFDYISQENNISVFYNLKNPENAFLNSIKGKWMPFVYVIIFVTVIGIVSIIFFKN